MKLILVRRTKVLRWLLQPWAISFLISVAALVPLLVRGPIDQEEYDLGVFSGWYAFESLLKGSLGLWLPDLGFGAPMPVGQSFGSYPLFFLSSAIGLSAWFRLFWVVQLWLACYFLLRICRQLGIHPVVALAVIASFAFGMPTVNYGMTDDWPTAFFVWTTYPLVMYLLTDLCLGADDSKAWKKLPLLGFVLGMWLGKGHPGHVSLFVIPTATYLAIIMPWQSKRILSILGLSCVVASLIALDSYAFLISEAMRFPSGTERITQPGYTLETYLYALAHPFASMSVPSFIGISGLFTNAYSRGPFFGASFMFAALCSIFLAAGDRRRLAVMVAAAAAFVLSMGSPSVSKVFSGLWLARDPLVFFGLLCAGQALTILLCSTSRIRRTVAKYGIALQLLHVILAFVPIIFYIGLHLGVPEKYSKRIGYAGEGISPQLKSWITGDGTRTGQRFLLSSGLQEEIRGGWVSEGLYGYTDLVKLGIPIVSGWFKNVSMDSIYPSRSLGHGSIGGDYRVLSNRSFLDVAGIRWIMFSGAESAEIRRLEVGPEQHYVGTSGKSMGLVENLNAWPLAVFVDADAVRIEKLPRALNCSLNGVVCADFGHIRNARQEGRADVHATKSGFLVKFKPNERDRMLFMSIFAHEGWKARTNVKELNILKVENAFVALAVPAGVDHIELTYSPRWRIGTLLISVLVGLVTFALAVMLRVHGATDVYRERKENGVG